MYRFVASLLLALSFSLFTQPVFAHKADYIDDTLVFETLESGEAEPEYFLDVGRRDGDRRTRFQRHTLAFEYGLTEHWMIDARASFDRDSGDTLGFDNFHIESRYRFSDEGQLPVDLAISAELFWEGSDIFGIAPRLILSKDFGALNLTLNLTEEIELQPVSNTAFQLGFGTRYDLSEQVRVGTEIKYTPNAHKGSVIPQVAFMFPYDITVKFGYSHGFDKNEERFCRAVVEVEF